MKYDYTNEYQQIPIRTANRPYLLRSRPYMEVSVDKAILEVYFHALHPAFFGSSFPEQVLIKGVLYLDPFFRRFPFLCELFSRDEMISRFEELREIADHDTITAEAVTNHNGILIGYRIDPSDLLASRDYQLPVQGKGQPTLAEILNWGQPK